VAAIAAMSRKDLAEDERLLQRCFFPQMEHPIKRLRAGAALK
jgi:hypothetical protein